MNRTKLCAALVGGMVLSGGALASADEFHYNNILIGDRAAGMGGAYTAISDDPSGMYYNPAGLAYASGRSISASVNAYTVSNRTYKGVIGGNDWKRSSSSLLPNFFGIVQPVGKFKVGFSYAVPDSAQEDQDQSFSYSRTWPSGVRDTTHVINFNNNNDINLFGPSAALLIKDNLSVGATLYIHKRSTERILNQSYKSTDNSLYEWINNYREVDEWGLRPVVGVMWAPADKFSLGLSVSKTYVLISDVLSQDTSITNDPPATTLTRTNSGMLKTEHKRDYPYQVAFGAAYFPTPSLLVSADISFNSSYNYTFPDKKIEREAVVNGALGAEYYINPNWAVRGGFFTDFANTKDVVAGGTNQDEHIDLFGGSLSISHFTKNTSLTFGGNYKYGSGKAQITANSIQDASLSSWSMFVSSSYSY